MAGGGRPNAGAPRVGDVGRRRGRRASQSATTQPSGGAPTARAPRHGAVELAGGGRHRHDARVSAGPSAGRDAPPATVPRLGGVASDLAPLPGSPGCQAVNAGGRSRSRRGRGFGGGEGRVRWAREVRTGGVGVATGKPLAPPLPVGWWRRGRGRGGARRGCRKLSLPTARTQHSEEPSPRWNFTSLLDMQRPAIVGNVYHPTWEVLGRTGSRFPYCGAETGSQTMHAPRFGF